MSTNTEGDYTDEALEEMITDEFGEAPEQSNPIRQLIEKHFGTTIEKLAVAADSYLPLVEVHLQNALEKFVDDPDREVQLFGVMPSQNIPITQLVAPPTLSWAVPKLVSPQYIQMPTSTGRRSVLRCGLYLTRDSEGPLALWVREKSVDIMSTTEERAQAIVDQLRSWSYELNPFKGQMITITVDCPGNIIPVYLERPREVNRDEVVLPDGLLERIEQHALGVSARKETLLNAGHSLRRSILLYGRPGTGKTHTIRYLVSALPDYTVLHMPAAKMQMFVDRIAEMVQYITPGIMIFDDVDLIAEDRTQWFTNPQRGPLFSLLELLDGIGQESDMLFILTTNVADRLEEAIAARPGRVDQAFEIPPPDGDCRRRLFELYANDVKLDIKDMDKIVERTEGVTGSFLKELIRRATVVSAMEMIAASDGDDEDEDDEITIGDAHVATALDQLLDPTNEMTAKLLGAETATPKPTLGQVAAAVHRR